MTKPPIQYFDDFLTPQEAALLSRQVWDNTPWERREDAPRREFWLNHDELPYTYGSGERARTYEGHRFDSCMTGWIAEAMLFKMHLTHLGLGDRLNCCFLNGYEDESDFLGWHSDDSPEMDHNHSIAVVSLGAEREIWVRPKGFKGVIPDEYRFLLGNGSLFIMKSGMQLEWEHRIPKGGQPCGPRVSFTYRSLITQDQ